MNRAIQFGVCRRTKAGLFVLAMLCLISASGSAAAQSANSTGGSPSPTMPPPNTTPGVPPPTTAVTPAPPPTPSMMPRVPGTELDRAVAIVNGELILDSDVNEELRLQAFDPYHSSSEKLSNTRAIERLINRTLIVQQFKLQPEQGPTDAEVNKQIGELRKDIPACRQYHCETRQGWDRYLADNGFTEASFFARWKERMTVLSFIEDRFQMGVEITPQQIQEYYDKTLVPEYQRQHAPAPKLSAIHDQVREVLLQQQISNLLIDWLKSLRAQGSIVVLHPGEEAP